MKKMKLRHKKRVWEFGSPRRPVLALLLFVVLENMGLKLQLRCSWSSYEGLRIVAACQNWDGCCCFGQKWGRGGDFEDLYCWGPGWDALPQFQHTIHHQQRHSYAEFYNPFSFFSSLSFSVPTLLRHTSHFICWNIAHPGP
jgi:hypothetical protein